MLMLTKTHAAIVAERDALIAKQGVVIDKHADIVRELLATAFDLTSRLETAEACLAVFTAPRARDARGHFLPTKKPIDHVIEALEAL